MRSFLIAAFVALALSAPLIKKGDIIPNEYIVILNGDIEMTHVKNMAEAYNAKWVYHIGSFRGFAATLSSSQLSTILSNAAVKFVEANQVARASGVQTGATWGIDRIDQENLPLDRLYHYWDNAGSGVEAYIIDTGILNTHNDFGGRSSSGYDFHNNRPDATDDNGHGTHVAGTVAGTTWGLAKSANLVGVKVLGRLGSGSFDNVIAGINWVADQHTAGARSTANMSLGGGASAAVDNAVNGAVADGVTMVVASGNDNANACNYSPARTGGPNGDAITVNASDDTDTRATFSNFGTCTDIFAPGVSVTSAWIGSNSATNTISGTSMASPHVCGATAVMLGRSAQTPAQIKNAINNAGTSGVIRNPGTGSQNLLLYSPWG